MHDCSGVTLSSLSSLEDSHKTDQEFYSVKKTVLFGYTYNYLYSNLEKSLKIGIETFKTLLAGVKDFWNTYELMKDYKSTTIYKSLSVNIRIKEIERIIEKLHNEIDNRDTTLQSKLQETANLYLNRNKIISNLEFFNENQKTAAAKLRVEVEKMNFNEFEELDLEPVKSIKKNFPLFVFASLAFLNQSKIITPQDTSDLKELSDVLQNKSPFLKLLKESEQLTYLNFKSPPLSLTPQLNQLMTKLVSIDDQHLPKVLQVLYEWCVAWYG